MNRSTRYAGLFLALLASAGLSSDGFSQACNITGTATPTTVPCGGGTVDLSSNGTGGVTFALDNDFNGGNAGPGWNVSPAGQFNNPCGASLDGSTYMWMGNTTAAPRTLQSAGLDVSCGGDICFDLKFSVQGGAAPCEGPDLTTEGVYLQYSIDGGATFTDIFYFQPNTATNAYTTWQNFCFPIPAAAQTGNTIFQWYQGGSSGTCCDHWGIDNVTITAQSCISYYYNWEHVAGFPDNQNQNGVFVDTDTTFTVWYTNGTSDSCFVDINVTVIGMGAPIIATVDEICLGDNTGQITLTANGGTPGYTYDINGPVMQSNGTGVFTNLPPGTYNVSITDAGACTVNGTATLNVGMNCCPMTSGQTFTDVTCNGGTDGTATGTQAGGVGAITYVWYDAGMNPIGQTTATATGLAAGTYIVEITDATPCTLTETIVISEPPAITFTTAEVHTTCGAANGSITFTAGGGTGALEYSIDGGVTWQPGNAFNALMAGNYDVWVRDAAGCTVNAQSILNNAGAPTITNIVIVDPLCDNSCDGTIDITATGGSGGYEYSINGGASYQPLNIFAGLCDGNITVRVRDSNGCTVDQAITLTDPAPVTMSHAVVDNLCFGDCLGTIDITAGGGTGAFQYSIDNGATWQAGNQFTNMCENWYDMMVQDANGCQLAMGDSVTAPDVLTMAFSSFDNTCNNSCDGYAIVIPAGGAGNYQFSWDGQAPTAQAQNNNLCANTYDLTVIDGNGCTLDNNGWVINEPAPFAVTQSSVNSNCNMPDGTASIDNVVGQNPGAYTYQWDVNAGSQTTAVASNLIPGSYDVIITDNTGMCDTTVNVTVGNNPGNVAQLVTSVDALCNGNTDGSIEVTSTGGTPGYTYQWDAAANNQTTAIASNLGAGTYTCVVTDANGCLDNITVTIAEPSLVVANTAGDTTICIGGTAVITGGATGGSGAGYTYLWDDPNASTTTSVTVNPAAITVYNMIAYDANGCPSAPVPVIVDLHPPLQVQALSDQAICPQEVVGISAIAQGGDGGPYTYDWDQGLGQGQLQNVSPAATTVYTVSVTDGCETPAASAQVTITVNPLPVVDFVVDNANGCSPVTPTFINTTDPSMVGTNCLWDFGDGNFSSDCNTANHVYTDAGCYDITLTVTSPQGCTDSKTVPSAVCVYAYPDPDFTFGPQPATIVDPTITFTNQTIETGSGATSYVWTFDELDTSNVENPVYEFPSTDAGTYTVCLGATSIEGCYADTCKEVIIDGEFLIYVPNAFTPDGDGLNDFFFPEGKGIYTDDYAMYIFDRWGELIFESHHQDVKWDGTKNGQKVKQDVYVWKVVTTDLYSGEQKEYVGHVSLLR